MFQKLLSIGYRKDLTYGEIRELESLNTALAVGGACGLLGFVLFLPGYFRREILLLPTAYVALVLVCFHFSARGLRGAARVTFWLGSILLLLAVVLVSDPNSLVHMYFLILMLASISIFPARERVLSIVCSTCCGGLFIVFQFWPVGGWGLSTQPPEADLTFARYFNLGATVLSLGFIGYSLAQGYARMSDGLAREQDRSDALLRNVLPESIVDILKSNQAIVPERRERVAVFFADIAGFTAFCNVSPPETVVQTLNQIFTLFDRVAARYGIEKIKTIGDAYMAVVGTPIAVAEPETVMARFALEARQVFQSNFSGLLNLRVGLHTGPVVAGIIGERRFSYDLWGATVNIASRLESHGAPGRIHVSDEFRSRCAGPFDFIACGSVELKGIGPVQTFFLEASTTTSE